MKLATLMTISLASAVTARADDKSPAAERLEGSWEGRISISPQVELRITLDLAKGKDGSLSGKWGSPDQGAKDLPFESIDYSNGVLTVSPRRPERPTRESE